MPQFSVSTAVGVVRSFCKELSCLAILWLLNFFGHQRLCGRIGDELQGRNLMGFDNFFLFLLLENVIADVNLFSLVGAALRAPMMAP